VAAFLDGRLSWIGIAEVLADVLEAWPDLPADSIDAVLDADARARAATMARVEAVA
jgi:1-deoxy-D-xylulose-5-phosphate reductoisomerase